MNFQIHFYGIFIEIFLNVLVLSVATSTSSLPNLEENYKLKYEYKYSFKGPHISVDGKIPFWYNFNDALPSEALIRIAPSLRAKHGAVWSKYPFPYAEWQIDVSVRVTGRGVVGADGLAIWYTEVPNEHGPVFGSKDNWKGMGILFDSFDNDGKKNNPYISLIVNNGTMSFSHATDGFEQINHGCLKDFRNRPYPIKARIIYAGRHLQLYIDGGNSMRDNYEYCTSIRDVDLPKNYYFGLSAATGGLADDHDVLKFFAWSLEEKSAGEAANEAEQKRIEEHNKLQEEYEKQLHEFKSQHERFLQENPDLAKLQAPSPEDLFQGSSSKEAKAVFEVQSDVLQLVNGLKHLTTLVSEKQEAVSLALEKKQPTQAVSAKAHEMDNSLALEKKTLQDIFELQSNIEIVKSVVDQLSAGVLKIQPGNQPASVDAGREHQAKQTMLNIMENLGLISQEIDLIQQEKKKAEAAPPCPAVDTSSCASVGVFVGVAVTEILIFVIYFTFKKPAVDPKKYF